MPPSDSAGPADFGTAFTALLAAAGLTVDGVLSALPPGRRGRVSRSTLYDWKKGEHLPLDATGPLLEVVRVCLDAARELGAGLAVWPASEEGWRWLLAEAKQARDADIAQARHGKACDPGSAWDKRPIGRQDLVSLGMPGVLRAGPPPGGGVFVGRADELAVLEAAAVEARGGRPKQHAGSRRDLNPELHREGIRPVLIEGLPHRSDHATNCVCESRQTQNFDRRSNPLNQPNISRASGLLTGGGWLGCLYANPYQGAAGQHHLDDLRRGSPFAAWRSCSFEGTSISFVREDWVSATRCLRSADSPGSAGDESFIFLPRGRCDCCSRLCNAATCVACRIPPLVH